MNAPSNTEESSPLDWSVHDAFAQAAHLLIAGAEHAAIEHLDANLLMLHTDRRAFVLLRYVRELEPQLTKIVAHLVAQPSPGHPLEIAVIGGDTRVAELVEGSKPTASTRLFHLPITDIGVVEPPRTLLGHGGSQLLEVLEAARRANGRPIDSRQADAAVRTARSTFVEHARQQRDFAELLNARKPIATYAILALIGVTFVLQLLAGSGSVDAALIEMGALDHDRVMAGEWWRLASATLLHGSLMHVAFNAYVLFALGDLVERLLGPSRFLLLYVVSGFAASCGSLLLNAGVSVGASGAIWGLLGAEAAIAFAPNQLLPSSIRKGAQRATVVNLALNTLASFLPRVDWAAHFAGGAAGALVLLSGLVLPRTARSVPTDGVGWRTLAAVVGALFFAAALHGVLQPWL